MPLALSAWWSALGFGLAGLGPAAMAMLLGHLAVPGHSAFLSSVAFRLAKAASSLPGVLFLWGRLATLKGFLQGVAIRQKLRLPTINF
jgi:hypothetical protein